MLTGMRVLVSARVAEDGEVIVIPRERLRRLLATDPGLGDTILAAFIARRSVLMTGASYATRLIGSRFCPLCLQVREFLSRSRIPYEWLDPDSDPEVEALLEQFGVEPDGRPWSSPRARPAQAQPRRLADPRPHGGEPARALLRPGVVGGGPAGLAAAVYGATEGLDTLASRSSASGARRGRARALRTTSGSRWGSRAVS